MAISRDPPSFGAGEFFESEEIAPTLRSAAVFREPRVGRGGGRRTFELRRVVLDVRLPADDDETKPSRTATVRVSEEDLAKLKALAAEHDLTIGGVVRRLLDQHQIADESKLRDYADQHNLTVSEAMRRLLAQPDPQ